MATTSQCVEVEGTWEEVVRRASQFAGKRVRVTVLHDDAPADNIEEHDVVRVRHDLEREGYSLLAGAIGAVVSVYQDGKAFAVEFSHLEKGAAVVTLRRNEVEKAEAKHQRGDAPNSRTAWVEEVKIREYLLNLDHPVGGPKAKFFQSCGFTAEHWQAMRDALVAQGATNPLVKTVDTEFGTRYTVECSCPTPD